MSRAVLLLVSLALFATVVSAARGGRSSRAPVTLAAAGDVALLGPAPSDLLARVRGPLAGADVALANLEGTLGYGGEAKCGAAGSHCYAFQSPPASAALLRRAGLDDLNVANNHALDYGAAGQRQTLAALAAHGLRWSGRPAQITVLRRHGVRIALLGFAPYPWAQSLTDIPAARRLVARAARRADLVVAMLHAGAEGTAYEHVPYGTQYYLGENRGDERRIAHALVDAGADLVVASGPHVLRGLQLYHGRLIDYSLGNFATCGNALATDGDTGQSVVLRVTLAADGRFVAGRLVPLGIVGGRPQPVAGGGRLLLAHVNALSRSDFGGSAVLARPDGTLRARGRA